ncbi:MAG: threonine/serine exporter family protein [Clostridia bacterium]|nr:threonine/serine exporter family protein [Clostridia bacterium]MBO5912895.1 threonine/serine exporter family protein [Clostridia bacterium]
MRDIIIQLVTAFFGAFGFALLFQLRKKLLIAAAVGGLINWGVYLLIEPMFDNEFIPCFVAAAVAVVYCEVAARVFKAPVTLFLVPSIVPSVPGSGLFYTMSSIVKKDWAGAKEFGLRTAEFALGIAAGICLAVVVFSIVNTIVHRAKEHKSE